jgi:hypothetical protein
MQALSPMNPMIPIKGANWRGIELQAGAIHRREPLAQFAA